MPRETLEKTINGNKYRMMQLEGRQGAREFARLVQIFGGAAGGVASGLTGANGGVGAGVAAGFAGLADKISPEQMDHFIDLFAPLSFVTLQNGKTPIVKDVFDDLYAGNYGEMIEWLIWCLEINFASFLADSGIIARLTALLTAESDSESPKA